MMGSSGVRVPASAFRMDLRVAFELDERGWVRATIEELPGALDEARGLVRDALEEWLARLMSD
jgi:hypothetical protein